MSERTYPDAILMAGAIRRLRNPDRGRRARDDRLALTPARGAVRRPQSRRSRL
jgi:hypothetical protein